MDCMIFNTEAAMVAARERIFANLVAAVETSDDTLTDVTTWTAHPKALLTVEDLQDFDATNRRFPIFGRNAATLQRVHDVGWTTAWDNGAQRATDGKWVLQHPGIQWLDGVTGFTVEPFDPAWFPPEE